MVSGLVVLLLTGLVLSPFSPFTPAASASSGSVSSGNGVLYDDCRYHDYAYSLSPDTSDWNLAVELVGPDGTTADTDYVTSSVAAESGTRDFLFCGYEQSGRYTIKAVLSWYDAELVEYTYTLPDAHFSMRKPRSRTTMQVSDATPHFNEVVRFRSQTKDERPAGYFGASYAEVRLQVLTRAGWRNLRGSSTYADERGVAVWRYRWDLRGALKLRAHTSPSGYTASSSAGTKVSTTRERQSPGRAIPSVPGIRG